MWHGESGGFGTKAKLMIDKFCLFILVLNSLYIV